MVCVCVSVSDVHWTVDDLLTGDGMECMEEVDLLGELFFFLQKALGSLPLPLMPSVGTLRS